MKKTFITLLAITLMAFGNTALADDTSSAIYKAEVSLTTVGKNTDGITEEDGTPTQYTKKFGVSDAIQLVVSTDQLGFTFGSENDDENNNDGLCINSGTISVTAPAPYVILSIKYTFYKADQDGTLVDESPADLSDTQYTRPASIIDNADGTSTYTYSVGDPTTITMEFKELEDNWIGLKKIEVEYTTNGTFNFYDQTKYYNTADTETASTFNYIRTYYGCWQSLYVPFSINVADVSADYEIATISNITADGMYISKMTSGSTEPNKFYLINKKSVSDAVNGEQAVINLTSEFAAAAETIATYGDGYTVTGTYTTFDTVGNANNPYTLYSEYSEGTNTSSLKKPSGSSHESDIPAQRWYVSGDFTSPAKVAIFVIGEDDTPTGVNTLQNDNSTDSFSYNLAGQRVMPNAKGMIIKNGKKYFNK